MSDFPIFQTEEGSGNITLKNTDKYTKLHSGIYYENVHTPKKGNKIRDPKQLVTITYSYFDMEAKFLHNKRFNSSVAEFAKEFSFKADITEAVMGMRATGQRRIIILPEIHRDGECRVFDVSLMKIKDENEEIVEEKGIGRKDNTNKVEEKAEGVEGKWKIDGNELLKTIIDKIDVNKVLPGVAAVIVGGGSVVKYVPGMISGLFGSGVISKDTEALLLQKIQSLEANMASPPKDNSRETKPQTNFRTDEQQTMQYPPQNPLDNTTTKTTKEWGGGNVPKITYKVMNEGEGEGITRYRQVCFEYNKTGSLEANIFNGSPTELAIKLFPGFEDAVLEAIVGMKLYGRRIIFIPAEVSGLGQETVLDLKLTSLNLWSRL